ALDHPDQRAVAGQRAVIDGAAVDRGLGQRQRVAIVELQNAGGGVVDLAAGDGDVVEDQGLAGADIDHTVVERSVGVDRAVVDDVDGAEIGRHGLVDTVHRAVAGQSAVVDGAAVDGGLGQRQGLAVVDLDGAAGAVVELAAGDGDVVEDQDLAGAEVDHAVVELGVDCGGAVDGDAVDRPRMAVVDLDGAAGAVIDLAAGDGDVVEDQRLGVGQVDHAIVELGPGIDRAVVGDVDDAVGGALDHPDQRAVAGQRAVIDGAAVDR